MNTLKVIAALSCGLHLALPAHADTDPQGCSTSMLAGRWLFATGIGHQALANAPPGAGDITALGTMNIRRNGDVEGTFSVTFEGAAFAPGVPYAGTVVVNTDCTGTLSFTTGAGTTRTDSIAVLSRYEIWGMSQDPKNLWTYQARRVSDRLGYLPY
jgi:hypothetical protein